MVDNRKILFFPYLIILYEIALYLSNDMYLPSMPAIAKDLSFSQHQIQSTLTFWFFGASSLQLVLGPVSERFGRRTIILYGAFAFIVSSILCACATGLSVFLLARFVQGCTICTLVAAYAAVHELYKTKQAIKLLAFIGAVTILAPAIGPLLGAIIVQFYHWRFVFWFLVMMGIFSFVSLYWYMPETNQNRGSLHLKTILKGYLHIIQNPNFLRACGGYFFLVSIQFIWIFETPFIMMEMYHTSALYYGIAQTLIFGCFFIGAAGVKWLLDRYDLQKLIACALSLTVFGTVMFLVVSIYNPNIEMAIVSMMIISLGSSMIFGPLNRIAIESCSEPIGMVTAISTTSTSISGALTGLILSIVVSRGLQVVAIFAGVCTAIATVLILITKLPPSIEE